MILKPNLNYNLFLFLVRLLHIWNIFINQDMIESKQKLCGKYPNKIKKK